MSDIGEVFAALKVLKKEKKLSNIEHSTYLVIGKGFDVDIKNNGVHLIVKNKGKTADFWPSTGLWQVRSGKRSRGVARLIKELEKE